MIITIEIFKRMVFERQTNKRLKNENYDFNIYIKS